MRSDRQAFNGPPVFAFSAQIPSPQLKTMCKMWKAKKARPGVFSPEAGFFISRQSRGARLIR